MPRIYDNTPGNRPPGEQRQSRRPRNEARHTPAGNQTTAQTDPIGRAARQSRPGSSFAARFGRIILQHGVAALPSALYHYQGELDLSVVQTWFISYILTHKWDSDLPYPSLHKMALCTGMSYVNLQRIKSRLCEMHYLKVVRRTSQNGGLDTSAYDFSPLFARLEKFISEDTPPPNPIREEGPAPDVVELADMDPSFVARFGRVIIRRGVATVPWAVYTHQAQLGLSPYHVWLITYIFSFQWDTGLPYPSLVKMSGLTGYSLSRIHEIKVELVQMGYLTLINRSNGDGGQDTNAYDFSGLLDAVRQVLQPAASSAAPTDEDADSDANDGKTGRKGKGSAQAEQEEDFQYLPRGAAPRRGRKAISNEQVAAPATSKVRRSPGNKNRIAPGNSNAIEPSNKERIGGSNAQRIGPSHADRIGASNGYSIEASRQMQPGTVTGSGRGLVTRAAHEIEPLKEESKQEDDSNQHSRKVATRTKVTTQARSSIPGYSPYIAAVAADFSRELGDAIHEASNMKQALNLWQSSGLSEQEFVDLMQEARKLTRKYQSRPTWDAMNNKMAYYFATLRDLIGENPRT
ncbi:MAG: hypothetical protein IVW55_03590 [Chloroflexi bacterium]|nr:hypothetical protein [Chloroflexota bacterium]